ncbi:hypothetical protein GVN16_03095 [Emticicia sp. CRIBPO]|uniref:hypothetical protein n=1 Tax=Emticicia sp. CRIBPO TaxID=2683258 RepID=UPI00141332B9|nr:hypothetical protein [Emticicia sp. CRIBPO]NBA84726.1 hypothetical protein [Emticicia sp. CRIBPO]
MTKVTLKVNYEKPVLIRYGKVINATRTPGTPAFFNSVFFPGDLVQGSSGGGGGSSGGGGGDPGG